MRIAGYFEHPDYHITIFEMNHRFSVKIEFEGLEQWYKLRQSEGLSKVTDVQVLFTPRFWNGVRDAFQSMKQNETELLSGITRLEDEEPDIL